MKFRRPTYQEQQLVDFLANLANHKHQVTSFMVSDMEDGGMGSLALYPNDTETNGRRLGKQASSCQFTDADGVDVIATLNLDQFGHLYELDLWKTNFSKLLKLPDDMETVQPISE